MLQEYYNQAKSIIEITQPNITQLTEMETMLYLKTNEITEELKDELTKKNYSFAKSCDGYTQILQPEIKHIPGQCYGSIPEEEKEYLNNIDVQFEEV